MQNPRTKQGSRQLGPDGVLRAGGVGLAGLAGLAGPSSAGHSRSSRPSSELVDCSSARHGPCPDSTVRPPSSSCAPSLGCVTPCWPGPPPPPPPDRDICDQCVNLSAVAGSIISHCFQAVLADSAAEGSWVATAASAGRLQTIGIRKIAVGHTDNPRRTQSLRPLHAGSAPLRLRTTVFCWLGGHCGVSASSCLACGPRRLGGCL